MDANYYDYLTGLPTMTYFFEISQARKDSITKELGQPNLVFLNLHGMKSYNQRFGFAQGNEFLKSFASLFSRYFGNDNCCRLGGVHFAAISNDNNLEDTLNRFSEEFHNIFSDYDIYPHIGVYQFQNEDVSINVACDRAKLACDTLKSSHNFGISYYNQAIRHAEENHRYIIENLNKAIAERWITVYYQPIVRAVNGKVCDEEALARWIDPVKGFLSPADFIPILEEEKLIYKLDLYVLERAIEKMKHFEALGITAVSHSINLSRSDFEVCDIVEEIRTRVDIAGIPRSKINIEITESVIGSDFDFITKQINRFKELGFQVWMDDFGAGYSTLNVLKEIPFDLIKFDMSFMRNFDKKDNGKIILAELMKMAFSIGVDTVCEGVESEEQLQFLKEIGCSKIQGYYYCKPIPTSQIFERIEKKINIGFENPKETGYYETIGRVNLHDLTVITYGNEKDFNNVYNMPPMTILEVRPDDITFIRSNQSYRNFFTRCFGVTLKGTPIPIQIVQQSAGATFLKTVQQVAKDGKRTFIDGILPDGSVANFFLRRLTENPVTKTIAMAVCVLSITDKSQNASYASITKALAADYFNLFYVNLETEEFIEYYSGLGEEIMSTERHGSNFFNQARNDARIYLYEEDQDMFCAALTKENILNELDAHGRFSITYRLIDNNEPFYVNMKVMRMQQDNKHIILAVSNIDSQMKQRELLEQARNEQIFYSRLMSLSGDFIAMYIVDPKTEQYNEYNSNEAFNEYGLAKQGENFFATTYKESEKLLPPEDFKLLKEYFTKENVLAEIAKKGVFALQYRISHKGEFKPISLRASLVKENGEDKIVVGIRL